MDIGNETVPVVDMATGHGILDVRSSTTTMTTMVKTVDGVASIIETLGDVVITPLMLSSTMNDHNNTLGIGNSVLLGEDLGAILVSRRHVLRRDSDLVLDSLLCNRRLSRRVGCRGHGAGGGNSSECQAGGGYGSEGALLHISLH